MSRVLVTPRSFTTGPLHPELQRLADAGHELVMSGDGNVPTADELRHAVGDCEAWLAGIEVIDRETLTMASNLKVIARHGVGVDSVDLAAADELGIAVVPSTGSNAEGVAELVVLHALALRRPHRADVPIDAPDAWKRTRGTELQGSIAAVVGYGAIGSRVAHLLGAFDVEIVVHDPFTTPADGHVAADSLEAALTGANLASLHCPPSEAPLIGPDQLEMLARGALLINTARGSLVDADAVLASLESGHLGGYGVDAFVTEPPTPHELWQHERVVATPHLGGFTTESVQRSAAMAVDTILQALT